MQQIILWIKQDVQNFWQARQDKWVWLVTATGTLGLLFNAQGPTWEYLAWGAICEEFFFRTCLQQLLDTRWTWRKYGITSGNLTISLLFALAHLWLQAPLWAAATLGPSLIFGWAWTRHHSLSLCSSLHFFYNLMFFCSIGGI